MFWTVVACLVLGGLITFNIWMFFEARKKEKDIMKVEGAHYQETYCTISLDLITSA